MLNTTDTALVHTRRLGDKTRPVINAATMPTKKSRVLRELLLDNRMRPYELSGAVDISNRVIHQLLHHPEIYPELSMLLSIANFFNITLGQLVGDSPLDSDEIAIEKAVLRIRWNADLYTRCAQYAIQLFKKHNVMLNDRLATKLILDIYRYSVSHNGSAVEEGFANWYVAHINKTII